MAKGLPYCYRFRVPKVGGSQRGQSVWWPSPGGPAGLSLGAWG